MTSDEGRPHRGRVVFVNRFYYPDHSATSQILDELTTALVQRGWQVSVVTSRLRYDKTSQRLPARDLHGGVSVCRVGTTSFGRSNLLGRAIDYFSFLLAARRTVADIAQAGTVVVAKTDPPMLGAFLYSVCRRRGALLVNWLQDLFPEIAQRADVPMVSGLFARVLLSYRNRAISGAAANVLVAQGMLDHLKASGADVSNVTVIPNWADGRLVRPVDRQTNQVREQFGIQHELVIGYSGNLGTVHDAETAIGAAAALSRNSGIRFLFVGGGRQFARLRDAIAERGLTNVIVAPYRDRSELSSSLGASDVHICSLDPRYEGLVLPSKLYGILAAGRPCIFVGDHRNEIARLITSNRVGLVVAPGDVSGFVKAVAAFSDERDRNEMGARARRLFESEFDLSIAARRWDEALGKCICAPKRADQR